MAGEYENRRDTRGLGPLKPSGVTGHKIRSVVPGAPDIIFKERTLTVEELKQTKKCKYNLRDADMLNAESVKDISTDMKDDSSNKAPAYGYIDGGTIFIITGNRRKQTIIEKGAGDYKVLLADDIRDEDKIALSKSFDVYLPPGAADKATTFFNLVTESKKNFDAGAISESDVITQNKLSEMYNMNKSTVSVLLNVAPMVKLIDRYFPVKSLIHYNFLKSLTAGGKDNFENTVGKINEAEKQIEEFSESKRTQLFNDDNYSAEECTTEIEKFILSLLSNKNKDKAEANVDEFEQFEINRKGLKIKRKANGNLTIDIKFDSQTDEVINLVKKLSGQN